jgi:hypothetical protein
MRKILTTTLPLVVLAIVALYAPRAHAQAALLLEQPYGFFGTLIPTGHNAVYFQNICAETPTRLRPCQPGEMGSVIARYEGIDGYDWVAIPLIPYLYAVETPEQVPQRVNRETVELLRNRYRERHLLSLGADPPPGNLIRGGWTQLVGVSYERRIYAFRFDTTPAQDAALIARLNADPNHSRFNLLYSNCTDFARQLFNIDFPHAFPRSIFPDAGMTTPKQLAWRLERYARKLPQTHLSILEIPQIPGYRRLSRTNKGVAESLTTTAYVVPIAIVNPYIAGGLFVDYLIDGRRRLVPKSVPILSPEDLSRLTQPATAPHTPDSAALQASAAAAVDTAETLVNGAAYSGLKETKVKHE